MFAEVNEAGVPGRPERVLGMGPGAVFTLDKHNFAFQCPLGDAGGKPAGRRPIPDTRFIPECLSQRTTNIHSEASRARGCTGPITRTGARVVSLAVQNIRGEWRGS